MAKMDKEKPMPKGKVNKKKKVKKGAGLFGKNT